MKEGGGTFALDLRDEDSEMFVVMTKLGFFTLIGDVYHVTIPQFDFEPDMLTDAFAQLLATEDNEYFLHPERLLIVSMSTTPQGQASPRH